LVNKKDEIDMNGEIDHNHNSKKETSSAISVHSTSLEDTVALAKRIAAQLQGGEVITLTGDLGAGKTSFTQGLAQGLGVKRHVNSPTFTIIKEYQGSSLSLYHMDVYRVGDEFEELGFEEYFYGAGVCVVEWPEMILHQLPKERLNITILKQGEEAREFRFIAEGKRYEQILEGVMKL
jgi:tRNA threonylcarbamoyladenosine biosynthesis protein TsaE